MIDDIFSPYEENLDCLVEKLGRRHPRNSEALVFQQRLKDNISWIRRHGDTPDRSAERSEIIAQLNRICLLVFDVPFLQMCSTEVKAIVPAQQTPNAAAEHTALDLTIPNPPTQVPPPAWARTVRTGTFLITGASIIWLVIKPGFEPLLAAIAGILGITLYLVLRNSPHQQYLDRTLAVFLAVFVPATIGLFILSARPTTPAPLTAAETRSLIPLPGDQPDTVLLFTLAAAETERLKTTIQNNSHLDTLLHSPTAAALSLAVHETVLASGHVDGSTGSFPAAHGGIVLSLAFGPNGTILASGGADGAIIFWDAGTHQPQARIPTAHSSATWQVAFHPGGAWLASTGEDGQIILWDVATQERIQQWSQSFGVKSAVFNADGSRLIAAKEKSISGTPIPVNSISPPSSQPRSRGKCGISFSPLMGSA